MYYPKLGLELDTQLCKVGFQHRNLSLTIVSGQSPAAGTEPVAIPSVPSSVAIPIGGWGPRTLVTHYLDFPKYNTATA